MEQVEAVMYMNINEDSRNTGSKRTGDIVTTPDWRVWSGQGYGQRVLSSLSQSKGYSYEVTDFGKGVSIRASYHNAATGRGVSKTYIVLFDDPTNASGTVFTSSNKWRSVSNPEQVGSYISMSIKGYASSTGSI